MRSRIMNGHVYFLCPDGLDATPSSAIGTWLPAGQAPSAFALHFCVDRETVETWRAELAAGRCPS